MENTENTENTENAINPDTVETDTLSADDSLAPVLEVEQVFPPVGKPVPERTLPEGFCFQAFQRSIGKAAVHSDYWYQSEIWKGEVQNPEVLQMIHQTRARFIRGSHVCYYPYRDVISLPDDQRYGNEDEFLLVMLHELAHWTGHKTRLDRWSSLDRHSRSYIREEIVAETTAMILGEVYHLRPRMPAGIFLTLRMEKKTLTEAELEDCCQQATQVVEYLLAVQNSVLQEDPYRVQQESRS